MPSGRITKRAVDALQCPAGRDRDFLWDDARAVLSELRALVEEYLFEDSQTVLRGRSEGPKVVAILTGSPEVIPRKI